MTDDFTKIEKYISAEEIEKQRKFSGLVKTVLISRYDSIKPCAFVHTYGCQGNVADSERIKGMLCEMGYMLTENQDEADLILFNTCAIREHAQDRVFGNIGAIKKLKAGNPQLKIVLCGCMMQQKHVAEKIKKSYPFVDLVFGTHVVHRLPELMYKVLCGGAKIYELPDSEGTIAEGIPVARDNEFKAWIPIMYGCNNFCSYCIVPYVRGRERSRSHDVIINEAKELVAAGYKEITLLGQNVNSYGNDLEGEINFSSLLRCINDIDGEFIVRFMTSHPKDCTHELLDTMAECEKVAKHLHLPFQSGNNRVLDEMNRHYTREKYLSLIEYAREVMPSLSITSDIIVGFPGETYEEFCDTLSLLKIAKFTSLFTFIFSPREGTKAEKMPDPVSREEKGKWFQELLNLQEKIAGERTAAMNEKVYRVLCENKAGDGVISGRTQGNVIIEFSGEDKLIGSFVSVKVTEPLTWIVRGKLV